MPFVHVAARERRCDSMRTPVLLGVHRGVVPNKPGVSPVPAAGDAAVHCLRLSIRVTDRSCDCLARTDLEMYYNPSKVVDVFEAHATAVGVTHRSFGLRVVALRDRIIRLLLR